MSHFFAYISRMKYVNRWSLMRNSLTENIQEHSHMVAVLAHALAVIRRDVLGIPCDPNACAAAALFHDATEIFTGDLPTPIKYYNPAILGAYRQVEAVAADRLLAMLPEEMAGAYRPLFHETDPQVRTLVKAADKLAAYIKCVEELAAGNNDFADAARETHALLEEMDLPELRYFEAHFAQAFGLTLDQLNEKGEEK